MLVIWLHLQSNNINKLKACCAQRVSRGLKDCSVVSVHIELGEDIVHFPHPGCSFFWLWMKLIPNSDLWPFINLLLQVCQILCSSFFWDSLVWFFLYSCFLRKCLIDPQADLKNVSKMTLNFWSFYLHLSNAEITGILILVPLMEQDFMHARHLCHQLSCVFSPFSLFS